MKIKSIQTKLKLILLCAFALNLPVHAQDSPYWNVSSGYWHEAGNWSGNSVPTTSSITYVQNSGTAIISNSTDAQAGILNVGGGDPGSLIIESVLEVFAYTTIAGAELSTVTVNHGRWLNHNNINIGDNGMLILESGTIQANSLILAQDGVSTPAVLEIGGNGSGQLGGTGTMKINGGSGSSTVRFTHNGTINFANPIDGANITVEQNGPGSTTLTANNNIHNLRVNQGNLNLAANTVLTLQGGNATVSNGGTLGGEGTLTGGQLTVENGGVLSTTLTLGNGLTLETGAILDYVDDGKGLRITDGSLMVDKGISVDFSSLTETGLYTVMDFNGAIINELNVKSFTAINLDPDLDGTFTVVGKTLTFTANAVPEPSTYLLLGAGLGILLITAHRRRNVQS